VNAAICPLNPPGHDWRNGLVCYWCRATRTPAEAIVSGLASRRGGDEDSARRLLDAYRAESFAEGARLIEDAACDADWTRTPDYCAGLRAGAELLLANTGQEATAAAATATPDPNFFVAGRTYTRHDRILGALRFNCKHLDTDPKNDLREAWGWLHRADGSRRMQRMWDDDYPKWDEAEVDR
jgi:hypothetical protein